MSETNKHITYTSEDIYQYLSGKLTPAQMHAMERAALNDPLLADAIEGYDAMPDFKNEQGFANVQADLAELRQKIDNPTPVRAIGRRWWQIAAAAVIIGAVFALFKMNNKETQEANNQIAVTEKKTQPEISADNTNKPIIPIDTISSGFASTGATQYNNLTTTNGTVQFTPSSNSNDITVLKDTTKAGALYNDDISRNYEVFKWEDGENNQRDQLAQKPNIDKAERRNEVSNKNYNNGANVNITNNNISSEWMSTTLDSSIATNNIMQSFSGKVVDNNNNAVPYASIIINNSRQSKTDAQGMFNITLEDTAVQLTALAKNYNATTTNINSNVYNVITLAPKKIILKKDAKAKSKKSNDYKSHRSHITILNKNNTEPKEGWTEFELNLTNLLSDSEYDDGKPVFGEMIVTFDVNAANMPVNFIIEKSINSDVDEAIENLIKNEFEWKAAANKSLPGTVKLKIIF